MPEIIDKSFEELSAAAFHRIARLRVDVFVVEQECPYPELDGRDSEQSTRHIWIDGPGNESVPAAYLRVLQDPDSWRIGRVVTAPTRRNEGLAGQLVDHVLGSYTGPVVLDAQSQLVGWYAQRGFIPSGPEFLDDGIPHVPMSLQCRSD